MNICINPRGGYDVSWVSYLFKITCSSHFNYMLVFWSCLWKGLWVGVPTHFLYCSLRCKYFWPTILCVHLVVTFMCLSMAVAWHFQNCLLEECGKYSSLGLCGDHNFLHSEWNNFLQLHGSLGVFALLVKRYSLYFLKLANFGHFLSPWFSPELKSLRSSLFEISL